MTYLSKGVVCSGATEQLLKLSHCGGEYTLKGKEAALWLNGRYGFFTVTSVADEQAVGHLQRMGLVECEEENSTTCEYRILTRCIPCPALSKGVSLPLRGLEKRVMIWLTKAGLHLTLAELIYLIDHDVPPSDDLLYTSNRQALVERIYTVDTIADCMLETQMETAASRDAVVHAVLRLLKKKKIVIL